MRYFMKLQVLHSWYLVWMQHRQGFDDVEEIEQRIEQRRKIIEAKINNLSQEALELLKRHRREIKEHLKEQHPEYYQRMVEIREHMEKE